MKLRRKKAHRHAEAKDRSTLGDAEKRSAAQQRKTTEPSARK